MLALVEPGDEVIAFEPYYDSYAANIADGAVSASRSRCWPLHLPAGPGRAGQGGDVADQAHPAQHPAQSTGSVFTRDELAAIADLAVERDLLVVSRRVNPLARRDAVAKELAAQGVNLKVAAVVGDDVFGLVDALREEGVKEI